MTPDNRTEDQKAAAVRASMTMAGYTMTTRDEEAVSYTHLTLPTILLV